MTTKMWKSLRAVRNLSTKRPGRSTKGDAVYESHMQAATVRHRRNRARTKEKKLPEIKPSPERFSGRRERAISSRNPEARTHRNKRLGVSGGLTKSPRNSNRASGAKRSGLTSLQPPKDTAKQEAGSKVASILESPETRTPLSHSSGALFVILGLTSGSVLWILRNEMDSNFDFPVVQKYFEEVIRLFRAETKPSEANRENNSETLTKNGWSVSSWRRS